MQESRNPFALGNAKQHHNFTITEVDESELSPSTDKVEFVAFNRQHISQRSGFEIDCISKISRNDCYSDARSQASDTTISLLYLLCKRKSLRPWLSKDQESVVPARSVPACF